MTVDTPLRQPGHDRPARGVSLGIPVGQQVTPRNRREKPHKMWLQISPLWAEAEKSRNERGSRRLVLETSWAEGLQNGARRDAVHALRPDRIRAMLIQPRRLAVVVLAIFCSSRLAHSGEYNY